MDKPFSLYSFITEVRKEYPTLGPNELTDEVLAALPPEHERAALEQSLRHTVSAAITKTTTNRPFLVPQRDKQPERDSSRSWKTAASRGRWERFLEEPFHIAPGTTRWIAFGDCTVDDLVQGSQSRRVAAQNLISSASAIEEWTELLVRHGVRRVRELPQSVLRERLERAAA
jgi:hypothetical protein